MARPHEFENGDIFRTITGTTEYIVTETPDDETVGYNFVDSSNPGTTIGTLPTSRLIYLR